MREAVKEPGPTVDFGKQAGDPDPRHQNIKPATERDDPVAFLLADRRDRQAPVGNRRIRNSVGSRRLGQLFQLCIERGGAFGPPFGKAVGDGKPEPPFGARQGEDRPWQKMILETAPRPLPSTHMSPARSRSRR